MSDIDGAVFGSCLQLCSPVKSKLELARTSASPRTLAEIQGWAPPWKWSWVGVRSLGVRPENPLSFQVPGEADT